MRNFYSFQNKVFVKFSNRITKNQSTDIDEISTHVADFSQKVLPNYFHLFLTNREKNCTKMRVSESFLKEWRNEKKIIFSTQQSKKKKASWKIWTQQFFFTGKTKKITWRELKILKFSSVFGFIFQFFKEFSINMLLVEIPSF